MKKGEQGAGKRGVGETLPTLYYYQTQLNSKSRCRKQGQKMVSVRTKGKPVFCIRKSWENIIIQEGN